MKFNVQLPMASVAIALALSGCDKSQQPGENPTNASEATTNAATDEATDATAEDSDEAVTVVDVPSTDSNTGDDAAVLTSAASIAKDIAQSDAVVRVRTDDGWAWKRNGDVIRTASRDGKRVAYYRKGEEKPFFVQEDDRAYAYADGKLTRRFDANGKAAPPSASDTHNAQQLAQTAANDRKVARQAPKSSEVRETRPGASSQRELQKSSNSTPGDRAATGRRPADHSTASQSPSRNNAGTDSSRQLSPMVTRSDTTTSQNRDRNSPSRNETDRPDPGQ
ncbi:hypothetical protein JQK15_26025 [Sphingobium sp. BHU LFT2]|uniref:hypothetical protein n=1 Tax=Sphingobium sp. BHU LFT2 TaxID=2807634 RepID=UPI001BE77E48|nr:hypothetical protein [Sphingobium sp. BHU LFT2]MBT2246956.1 hypothetical protein [Sphingobium sp. BHU LFT2]